MDLDTKLSQAELGQRKHLLASSVASPVEGELSSQSEVCVLVPC
jgi:hypothetical protein